MSWSEDAVTFRGFIRKSGNSLVITIPAELSQRFLLREGQEFIIFGMSRRNPDFEGALQIYLGYFTVYEKAPTVVIKIRDKQVDLDRVEQVAKRYGASRILSEGVENDETKLKIIFGGIENGIVKRPKTMDEVKTLIPRIIRALEEDGYQASLKDIKEEIFEWHEIDPATISKAPTRFGESIRWKWET